MLVKFAQHYAEPLLSAHTHPRQFWIAACQSMTYSVRATVRSPRHRERAVSKKLARSQLLLELRIVVCNTATCADLETGTKLEVIMEITRHTRDGLNIIRTSARRFRKGTKAALQHADEHNQHVASEAEQKTKERFDAYLKEFAMKETE